jgi:hypothetical protein
MKEIESGVTDCWCWNLHINILEPSFIEINFRNGHMVEHFENVRNENLLCSVETFFCQGSTHCCLSGNTTAKSSGAN